MLFLVTVTCKILWNFTSHTYLTVLSLCSFRTCTCITVYLISTDSSILARIFFTFINICKYIWKYLQYLLLFKEQNDLSYIWNSFENNNKTFQFHGFIKTFKFTLIFCTALGFPSLPTAGNKIRLSFLTALPRITYREARIYWDIHYE